MKMRNVKNVPEVHINGDSKRKHKPVSQLKSTAEPLHTSHLSKEPCIQCMRFGLTCCDLGEVLPSCYLNAVFQTTTTKWKVHCSPCIFGTDLCFFLHFLQEDDLKWVEENIPSSVADT